MSVVATFDIFQFSFPEMFKISDEPGFFEKIKQIVSNFFARFSNSQRKDNTDNSIRTYEQLQRKNSAPSENSSENTAKHEFDGLNAFQIADRMSRKEQEEQQKNSAITATSSTQTTPILTVNEQTVASIPTTDSQTTNNTVKEKSHSTTEQVVGHDKNQIEANKQTVIPTGGPISTTPVTQNTPTTDSQTTNNTVKEEPHPTREQVVRHDEDQIEADKQTDDAEEEISTPPNIAKKPETLYANNQTTVPISTTSVTHELRQSTGSETTTRTVEAEVFMRSPQNIINQIFSSKIEDYDHIFEDDNFFGEEFYVSFVDDPDSDDDD